jgi:hypothetical protein
VWVDRITTREKVSTLGRTTTVSRRDALQRGARTDGRFDRRSVGEAFRKLSRSETLNSSADHADRSNVVRFGKTNWLKGWGVRVKNELFQIHGTFEEGE